MLAAIQEQTVLVALLPAFTVVATLLVVAVLNRRAQLGPALDYADRANEALNKENKELKRERVGLIAELEACKTRTDVAAAIKPLEERLIDHDRAMQTMMDKHLDLIKIIADEIAAMHRDGNENH